MIAAIIQARMGSTRLPGKVLKEVLGKALLLHQVDRIKRATLLDHVIVATSTSSKDEIIFHFCQEHGIECFRGSEDDVLGRYYECANAYNADTIVRLTADCPLIDPDVIDQMINLFKERNVDYAGNTVPPETSKFPDGSDIEVISREALSRAYKESEDPRDREHVTFYFWRYDHGFKTAQLDFDQDWSPYRFTIDYPEDYEVIKFIFEELERKKLFGHVKDIVAILDANPSMREKNSKYHFGLGWKQ